MNRDLTVGEPSRVLWQFCLPLFGSVIFQQMYNLADSLVVGRFVGENALAAVGNSYEVTLIFLAFAFGCNIGCSVIVSQLYGAKEYRNMKTAVTTTLLSAAVLCAVLMASGILGCGWLLALIRTPEEILADSVLYLDIYIWGLPFLLYYNVATGIFSALGDSKTPFLFLAASSVANVAADVVFVSVFGMGVAGVAWATFLCQGVSCVLSLFVVFRRLAAVETREKAPLFSWRLLGKIVCIALPSTLQQSFVSVGNIILQSVINGFGPSVIAGYAAAVKLNNLVITSLTTLGNGISNYSAQNIGAGRYDRVRTGFRAGLRMVWTLCVPLTLLYFAAGRPLLSLFLEERGGLAMETGLLFLRILSPFYCVISAKLAADGVLRGGGLMGRFMAATFTDLVLRVVLALVLSRTALGSAGIWCAWPLGWFIGMLLSLVFYRQAVAEMEQRAAQAKQTPAEMAD